MRPLQFSSAICISFCVAQVKSASTRFKFASGSRVCASRPAEMVSTSGVKSRRRGVLDRLDVIHRMTERDRVPFAERRLLARERLEGFCLERLIDGAQPVGPLGMSGGRQVIETGGMGHEEGGHEIY